MVGRFLEAAQLGTLWSRPGARDLGISPFSLFFRIIVMRFSRSITSRLRLAGKRRRDVLGLRWCEDGAPSSLRDVMLAGRCLNPPSGAPTGVGLLPSGCSRPVGTPTSRQVDRVDPLENFHTEVGVRLESGAAGQVGEGKPAGHAGALISLALCGSPSGFPAASGGASRVPLLPEGLARLRLD